MKASVRFVDATALIDLVNGGELRQKPKEKIQKSWGTGDLSSTFGDLLNPGV